MRLFYACTLLYSFDKLTEDKHIVKTKIYSLSIGYIINFCPIDRESEVPTDINVKVDLSPQLLQDLKWFNLGLSPGSSLKGKCAYGDHTRPDISWY